jgi:hypothetical protein
LVASCLLGGNPTAAPLRRESPSKAALRVALELAYSLAADAEFVAEFDQGRWLPGVQPVPAHQDVPLTGRHLIYRLPESCVLHILDHRLGHLRSLLVLDELAELP